jgi:hypothetical protein
VFTVDNECIEQERDFEVLAATVFGGKISVYLPEDFVCIPEGMLSGSQGLVT